MLKQFRTTLCYKILYVFNCRFALHRYDCNAHTVRNKDVQEETILAESWIGYVR